MSNRRWLGRSCCRFLVSGLAAPVALSFASSLPAADAPVPDHALAVPIVAPVPGPLVLDLAGAHRLALEKQPHLAAFRASLAAAQAKVQALDNLPALTTLTNPDLKYRRCQANLGVQIAEAQLNQGAWDTQYAVTRAYWSAVYADEQLAVAQDTLNDLRKRIPAKTTYWTQEYFKVFVEYLEGRKASAVEGRQRALAALREAIGLGPEACLEIADKKIPAIDPAVCKEEIVRAALARRGELAIASLAAEVATIEVDAQHAIHGYSARTFASGGDIHARPVPLGNRGSEYVPDAVGLEMPAMLAGSRHDRVEQARAYSARAHAVVEKARQLIGLEAESVFHQWREAVIQVQHYARARDLARTNAEARRKEAEENELPRSDAIRSAEVYTQMRIEVNEALYRTVLALAALERVTAGGFCAAGPAPAQP